VAESEVALVKLATEQTGGGLPPPPPPPAEAIVTVKVAVAVPQGLVIETGTLKVPDSVGVPEIVPAVESKFKPFGKRARVLKMIAPEVAGVVVAIKV
jgi:hypothetical protein